jgi:hypothetical protein
MFLIGSIWHLANDLSQTPGPIVVYNTRWAYITQNTSAPVSWQARDYNLVPVWVGDSYSDCHSSRQGTRCCTRNISYNWTVFCIIRINIYVKHNFLVYLLSAATCFDLRSSSGHALMQVRKCHTHIGIPYVYNMKTFVIITSIIQVKYSWVIQI